MSTMIRIIIKKNDVKDIIGDIQSHVKEYVKETKRSLKTFHGAFKNKQWIEDGSYNEKHRSFSYDYKKSNPILRKWPDKTDLCCWYCTRVIKRKPMQLPFKKELVKDSTGQERDLYYLKGCFCSFECAYTWNYFNEDFGDKWNQQALLYEIYFIVGNSGTISFAPKKETLINYGGVLTDEEYEKCLKSKNIIERITELPYMSTQPIIDFTYIKPNNHSSEKQDSKKDITSNNNVNKKKKYKIYRKNPLFKSINNFFVKTSSNDN